MKIGELARVVGVRVDTIRYYEAQGLLSPHPRTEGGYRVFGPQDVERLSFIKKAKRLGLSLAEVKEILTIESQQQPTCRHVRSLLETKVVEIDEALRELEALRRYMVELVEQSGALEDCRPTGGRICSIIEQIPLDARPAVLQLRGAGRAPRHLTRKPAQWRMP